MLRFFISPDKARYIEEEGLKWVSRSYSREIYVNVITEFPDFPPLEYGRAIYCYEPSHPAAVQLICRKAKFKREAAVTGIIYRRVKQTSGATVYQWVFFFDKAEYEECKARWIDL